MMNIAKLLTWVGVGVFCALFWAGIYWVVTK